ncbi:C-type lectin domain family 6 member A [Lingula anatina]|uniref:C-type lectin domain family 6 member A n=1 Tax=Lingula anatina TaxID=7574 RepID=A0A1S3H0X9_LINAN|nr:C-type lectin domain family 6 member A [Lingula anatina]|eukprot:XP_013378799.1 C-type lectin domain family 6 member A [Lingula anatina]
MARVEDPPSHSYFNAEVLTKRENPEEPPLTGLTGSDSSRETVENYTNTAYYLDTEPFYTPLDLETTPNHPTYDYVDPSGSNHIPTENERFPSTKHKPDTVVRSLIRERCLLRAVVVVCCLMIVTLAVGFIPASSKTCTYTTPNTESFSVQGNRSYPKFLPECPPNFISANNSCYFVNSVINQNWTESQAFCQRLGANLVAIESRTENEFIINILRLNNFAAIASPPAWWIGATDTQTEGHFVWAVLNTTVDTWFGRKPDNANRGQDCATIRFYRKVTWNDKACRYRRGCICELQIRADSERRPKRSADQIW